MKQNPERYCFRCYGWCCDRDWYLIPEKFATTFDTISELADTSAEDYAFFIRTFDQYKIELSSLLEYSFTDPKEQ
jgi:hypothetical protein